MKEPYIPSASYNLWSMFKPAVGKEEWYCDMKRGFTKVRHKEPEVKALLDQDTIHQEIGKLAQRGVYEFHQDIILLEKSDGVEIVAEILKLKEKSDEAQVRVISILHKYYQQPILLEKNIISLSSGDEGFPNPIRIQQGSYIFNLYAPTDCMFSEPDGKVHILDFKTGKSNFDRRQAYVYLLAASYLHPQQPAIASFYNLENGLASEIITASAEKLKFVEIELEEISKRHENEKRLYRKNLDDFAKIFPPNPGITCKYCAFKSICKFSQCEVVQ
ncbi:PD-(D/E)XK nuclease family protein [Cylindrospermum sp. FACHB-282]|uniref:PD-(D/E)XK nuclease family protein n=1 Tax=Cylindrospermum sp. FACHB-282 TaxID=2692794 RepID=UPI00168961AA|nr:PD-(D/E)XK nuclease family protein [Cylindrospermum sp. FACHB-282]MBD2384003.1 PD-(D/E)XK nuclease family protein [Cylindrospermum sp. FACHB-282]